jgi:hypothetical protein
MSNNDLQNIADSLESQLDDEYVENVANVIKLKIIAVAYGQSINIDSNVNSNGYALKSKKLNFGVQRGNHRELLGSYDTVMDKKLSVKIESLVHYSQSNNITIGCNLNNLVKGLYRRTTFKDKVPEIISKIQQLFPQMKITVDPLETYILFDWSD